MENSKINDPFIFDSSINNLDIDKKFCIFTKNLFKIFMVFIHVNDLTFL